MNAPEFWRRDGFLAHLLTPATVCWRAGGAIRRVGAKPSKADIPVICVGNAVAGGAGKTPVAMSLARMLIARGVRVHLLSRGYGGSVSGPVRVDVEDHGYRQVGDESLLLASVAPTWVSRDRVAGVRAAAANGAQTIVMDDGLQNPHLLKDLSILVVDGSYGFGNGRLIPAGPLREPVADALARVEAVALVGEDRCGVKTAFNRDTPVHSARMAPVSAARALSGRRVVAFAGIGRPEKFFRTLGEIGCKLVEARPFGDHHAYNEVEIMRLCDAANAADAVLVTTEKDHVRLPAKLRSKVRTVAVEIDWHDGLALERQILGVIRSLGE